MGFRGILGQTATTAIMGSASQGSLITANQGLGAIYREIYRYRIAPVVAGYNVGSAVSRFDGPITPIFFTTSGGRWGGIFGPQNNTGGVFWALLSMKVDYRRIRPLDRPGTITIALASTRPALFGGIYSNTWTVAVAAGENVHTETIDVVGETLIPASPYGNNRATIEWDVGENQQSFLIILDWMLSPILVGNRP